MNLQQALGVLAGAMAVFGAIPYWRALQAGRTKPHIFTWIIWTALTAIAYVAQVQGGAGPGAWTTGITALLCVFITAKALAIGDKDITKGDWAMFAAALAAIPVWLCTKNPLAAVVIVTFVDVLAFGPTIRKSFARPHEETAFTYGLNALRHMIAILALADVSLTTALYPAALAVMNGGLFALLYFRQRKMPAA